MSSEKENPIDSIISTEINHPQAENNNDNNFPAPVYYNGNGTQSVVIQQSNIDRSADSNEFFVWSIINIVLSVILVGYCGAWYGYWL